MRAPELAQRPVRARLLEYPILERSSAQLLRQMEGIALVALLAPALRHRGHDDSLGPGREDLVEPPALRPLLQTDMFPARDGFELGYQRLAAGLDDVRPQPSATLVDDGKRRACGMHIQSDIRVHTRPLFSWLFLSATKAWPSTGEDANLLARATSSRRESLGRRLSQRTAAQPSPSTRPRDTSRNRAPLHRSVCFDAHGARSKTSSERCGLGMWLRTPRSHDAYPHRGANGRGFIGVCSGGSQWLIRPRGPVELRQGQLIYSRHLAPAGERVAPQLPV